MVTINSTCSRLCNGHEWSPVWKSGVVSPAMGCNKPLAWTTYGFCFYSDYFCSSASGTCVITMYLIIISLHLCMLRKPIRQLEGEIVKVTSWQIPLSIIALTEESLPLCSARDDVYFKVLESVWRVPRVDWIKLDRKNFPTCHFIFIPLPIQSQFRLIINVSKTSFSCGCVQNGVCHLLAELMCC